MGPYDTLHHYNAAATITHFSVSTGWHCKHRDPRAHGLIPAVTLMPPYTHTHRTESPSARKELEYSSIRRWDRLCRSGMVRGHTSVLTTKFFINVWLFLPPYPLFSCTCSSPNHLNISESSEYISSPAFDPSLNITTLQKCPSPASYSASLALSHQDGFHTQSLGLRHSWDCPGRHSDNVSLSLSPQRTQIGCPLH